MQAQATTTPKPDRYDPALSLKLIDVEWNPRPESDYSGAEFDEFVASVDVDGVRTPIEVRELPGGRFGLVAGERRVRASRKLKRDTIPAVIKKLDEYAALRDKAVENDQRSDLDPVAQGKCYERMANPPKGAGFPPRTIADIAKDVGRSPAYVSQRIALANMCEAGRKMLLKNEISFSSAVRIARIANPELQAKLVKEIQSKSWMRTDHQIDHLIKEHYVLRLVDAPFDTKDSTLTAAAGACDACPKRSTNRRELFTDVAKDDLCTDAACHKVKCDAHFAKVAAAAEQRGVKVLPDTATAKIFNAGDQVFYGGSHVKLDDKCTTDPRGRTYRKLLPKDAPVQLAKDHHGRPHEVVETKALPKLLKAAGHKFTTASNTLTRSASAQREDARRREAGAKRRAVTYAVLEGIAEACKGLALATFMDVLIPNLLDCGMHDCMREIVNRRKWAEKGKDPKSIIVRRMVTAPVHERMGVALELVLARNAYGIYRPGTLDGDIAKAARKLGLKPDRIQAGVLKQLGDKARERAKAKRKAKAKAK